NRHHGNIRDIRGYKGELSKLKDTREIDIVQKQLKTLEKNIEELRQIYNSLENNKITDFLSQDISQLVNKIIIDGKRFCRVKDINFYFLLVLFFSVLLDADKIDASGINTIPQRIFEIDPEIVDSYKRIKFSKFSRDIDKIREKAYLELTTYVNKLDINNKRILGINLPTGMGKTLSGISFAIKLRNRIMEEEQFTPRILYLLPFLSIIDQNSDIVLEVLKSSDRKKVPSNLLLKHHHLADIEYVEEIDEEEYNVVNSNQSLLLTEGWHSEIVITTFIQFFHSLITNKNRAARKINNISNSIIILDEIQSIPHKYWLLVNHIFRYLAQYFNCWIILMTATLPLIFEKDEINNLIEKPLEYFNVFDRIEFNFNLKEQTLSEFQDQLLYEIKTTSKNIMVVLNSINSCKALYSYLKDSLAHEKGLNPNDHIDKDGVFVLESIELIHLSTHIIPKIRLEKINRIKYSKKRKVIITTQLIEAGVDISVDIVYRDFAPLDCIIQTAGRCNRNNSPEKGQVHVITLINDNQNRRYSSYVYDSTLLDATQEVISKFNKTVSENSFTFLAAQKYYTLIKKRGSTGESKKILNSLKLLNLNETRKFRLIEDTMITRSIFIEIDENAKQVREEIERLYEIAKGFELKNNLLQYRRCINDYTISIRCNEELLPNIDSLPSLGQINDFKYVPYRNLENWYKLDSGFVI
ncbi:MAG: CRISPR-associated helicase Cas3', partial [Promethearchaeota archaeon]